VDKLIIENRTNYLTDLEILDFVKDVVEAGKISGENDHYCYLSIFTYKRNQHEESKKYSVSVSKNRKSYRFVVLNYSK